MKFVARIQRCLRERRKLFFYVTYVHRWKFCLRPHCSESVTGADRKCGHHIQLSCACISQEIKGNLCTRLKRRSLRSESQKNGESRLIYISHCIAGRVPRRHRPPLHDGLQQVQRPAVRRLVAERSQQAARHGARRLLLR